MIYDCIYSHIFTQPSFIAKTVFIIFPLGIFSMWFKRYILSIRQIIVGNVCGGHPKFNFRKKNPKP